MMHAAPPAMREPDTAPGRAADTAACPAEVSQYWATLPATSDGVLAARHFARAMAAASPRIHDVELVVCELALCAIRGSVDGEFALTAMRHRDRGWLYVAATRAEAAWFCSQDSELAHGYGLMIVDGLADRWGSYGVRDADCSSSGTATTWAELSWT